MKKIVLTGGGTAGHVYPALALNENLYGYEVHYIGGSGMEKGIVEKEKNITFHQIHTVKLERKLTIKNLLIPFKLYKAIRDAKRELKKINPNVIFSKGGFVAVPVVIAGHSLGIPIVSHESDLSLGLANKIILHYCDYMCTSFEATAKNNKKLIFTGPPIRKKIFNGDKNKILSQGSFSKTKTNLLVLGGSTGAKFINELVWANLDELTKLYNIVHITGRQNAELHSAPNYLQIDYAENIEDFYAFADIILSRAGSGAINEFVALRKPALLIPLSKNCSRGDQIENAKLFASLGVADFVEEEELNNNIFMEKLENLVKNAPKITKNMKNFQNFNSCDKIIELIKKVEIKN